MSLKIFITTGTTRFDSLIATLINSNEIKLDSYIIQSPSVSNFESLRNYNCFEYTNDIRPYIEECDLIITHAGAGNVYRFLEFYSSTKKIIIVPNLERKDKHQAELAEYIESNKFAFVCWNVENIVDSILNKINDFKCVPYKKVSFFKQNEIVNCLL